MEIWKTVNGYEGLYEVSNKGRVRSLDKIVPKWDGQRLLKGKILKGGITRFGYVKVILTKEKTKRTFLVHRLVAEAFIENDNPKSKNQVNHIDGDKLNNSIENLEWVTASENVRHAFENGLKKPSQKSTKIITQKGYESNIEVLQFTLDGVLLKKWHSMTEASNKLGINLSSISMCCSKTGRKRKTAGGFKWTYAETEVKNNE